MPLLGPPDALSPRTWRAIVDYDAWDDPYVPPDAIALHHGGGSDYASHNPPYSIDKEIQQLQQWEGYHLYGRGWRGLAYGWAIGQTGTIYRARGFNRQGAHRGDMDGDGISNNTEILSAVFIGSGHHADLSPAAEDAVVRLRSFAEAEAGVELTLYGHQELEGTATSCPGPKLMTYVRNHRQLEASMLTVREELFVKDLFNRMEALYPGQDVPTAAGISTYLIPELRKGLVNTDELKAAIKAAQSDSDVDAVIDEIVTRLSS